MISLKEVEIIHNILIDKFGGSKGIRDVGKFNSYCRKVYILNRNNFEYRKLIRKLL